MTRHASKRRHRKHRPRKPLTPREQMALRCFPPKNRDLFLKTLRYALRVRSVDDLPKVFHLPVAVALKPGSQDELAARFNVPKEQADPYRMAFNSAMTLYCRSSQYGHALLTCEQLFSIDMEPAGAPTGADRKEGRTLIDPSARKTVPSVGRAHGKKNNTASTPAPETPGPAKDATGQAPGNRTGNHGRLTPHQKRTFHPEQFKQLRKKFCQALGVTEEGLPPFLADPIAVPLKSRTSHDLSQRYGLSRKTKSPEMQRLDHALWRYCGSNQYQHAILNCDTRFSIDMEPDAPINEEAHERAIQQLRVLAERRRERRAKLEQAQKNAPGGDCR